MESLQAFTSEIDDIEKAVTELVSGIEKNRLRKNSIGILYCAYEMDVKKFLKLLEKAFDFPFVGCTAVGMLTSKGYSQTCISLLVMTADDCEFSFGLTDKLENNSDVGKISEKYRELSGRLPEKEKLILMYTPWIKKFEADYAVEELNRESGGVPVFGGIASDGWTFDEDYVFAGSELSQSKAVLVLISGNIRPIFSIAHSTTKTGTFDKIVTNSEGRIVYTLDDEPIVDYLEKNGFVSGKTDVMLDYLATPFITTMRTDDDDEIDILRCLVAIDHKKKSCRFIGQIEQGSEINMVLIGKTDIEGSAREAFGSVIDRINKTEDYNYSTILVSSCVGRYCLIVSDKNAEGRAYAYNLPEGVNLNGFYGFSEYCPAKGKKRGKLYNALNNESLAVLAI